jgi:hypothetical protein
LQSGLIDICCIDVRPAVDQRFNQSPTDSSRSTGDDNGFVFKLWQILHFFHRLLTQLEMI